MKRSTELPIWLYGLVAVGCCAVLLAAWLSAASLLPIDETRYAGVAWEMLRSGDWLVPHNNGAPYPDKPPLLFWLVAGGWSMFGASIWWARLVPTLFSLGSLGMTCLLVRHLWLDRPRIELLAPTVLLGCVMWVVWTPLVLFDVLLTFWVLVAITGVAMAGMRHKPVGWLLCAAGIGLGTLSKGPVAILHVLPVALLAPLWLPAPRPRWKQWYGHLLLAVLGGAGIAMAWAIPAGFIGGEAYAHAIFWGQSAGRVAQSFAHARPWWWYMAILPLFLAPWCFWPTAWRALARLRLTDSPGVRFVLCWVAPVFVAFCLISGKQIHYLLPLLPGVALLLGLGLDIAPRTTSTAAVMPITLLCLTLAAAVIFGPSLQAMFGWPAWSGHLPRALGYIVLLAGLLPLLSGRDKERRVIAIAAASIVFVAALVWLGLPATAPRYDLRKASHVVAQAQSRGVSVAHVGEYDDRFQFLGRLSRSVTVVQDHNQAFAWAQTHPHGLLVVYFDHKPHWQMGSHAVFKQPYRGGWLAIVHARNVSQPAHTAAP